MATTNRNRLLEKYVQVVREDGLNTNKNVNIGIAGAGSTATLSVGTGGVNTTGTVTAAGIVNTGTSTGSLKSVVALTAATQTPTAAQSGTLFNVTPASGGTLVTLPAPTVGLVYDYLVSTAATGSNTLKWITNTGTVFLQGLDIAGTGTAAATNVFAGNGSSHISVNMNGTTTGGLVGTYLQFYCVSSTLWQVNLWNIASGTVATSFGTS